MTLHWWMHWFWITVIIPAILAVFLSAPLSHAAPYSSPGPELTLPVELLSTGAPEPPTFHHDSSLYVALVHGPPSLSTFTDDSDVEDTPSPGAIFPLQGSTDTVILPYPPSETVEEHAPSQMTFPGGHRASLDTHDDNPIEEEVLASQEDNGQTKMIVRDISLASRSGKAIGRDFISSSPIPQVAAVTPPPAHVSNHNPFLISDELPNKNEPTDEVVKKSVVPVTAPSSSSSEVVDKKHEDKVQQAAIIQQKEEDSNVSATSPKEQEATASPMTSAPTLAEKTDDSSEETEVHSFEVISTATPVVLPSLLPPAWVPHFSSEEESVEEEEAEENARPNSSITEEQPTEPDSSDVSSEAVTRGRMTSEQGLEAPAIVGIVLGLIGLVSLIGGASGFVWYRRRYLNKPQTLNDKCSNADSSGYIDDTLRVSAARMNTVAGAPAGRARRGDRVAAADRELRDTSTLTRNKDNSEEMYSLDNDSFLNSLEAMTIQNYWTDSVKHTKL